MATIYSIWLLLVFAAHAGLQACRLSQQCGRVTGSLKLLVHILVVPL
jgi:hypothetical protein